ncbi:BTAD domain-containing putative transcriptional regulator [Streptomyces sp. NPDC057806]|uniref:AfsR/SARP family transcriptional regulator n=1 Tax=Streptomyces sp. NPDC057806 TaxID=3346255 RepID=UPI0036AB36B8
MTATLTGLPELRIKVLGPLEIHVDGECRTLTAPMARRAMAVLLLDANHLVSTQALVEELWDEDPPRLARKTVQTYIYQLRQALKGSTDAGGERLETGPGGYRLTARPGELDLWEFEQRAARARAALASGAAEDAARLLREGLALWRGEPFAGLEAGPLLTARIAQIGEARLSALELRIEADLQLGRHQALVAELRRLTVDHPLDERFTAQLMIAAHRSGQRSTALDAYLRLRNRLVDDLGIEPSERVRQLQQDILREVLPPAGKPERAVVRRPAAPAPVTPAVDQLPPEAPDFVGREPELARIRERFTAPGPQVITLLGPAGVGKTALAVRAARAMAERFPDGLLYASLHDSADRPRSLEAVLRSLLDGLGIGRPRQPEDTEGLAALFRAATRERSLLVLLDDAAATDQVLALLPGGDSCLTLVTSRVRLSGLPGARRLTLGPLGAEDATAFFERLVGAGRITGHHAALRHMVTRMGRHPLMLRAVGELYAARPMWTLSDLAAGLLDDDRLVAELQDEACAALARADSALARLAPWLRRSVFLLAAAGPGPFDTEQVKAVLELDTWSAQSVVGRLLDRHVLVLADAPPGASATFRVPEIVRFGVLAHAAGGSADRGDSAWSGAGRSDSAWSEVGRNDPARCDAGRKDSVRSDAGRTDPAWSDAGRTEHVRSDAGRSEAVGSGAGRTGSARDDAGGTGPAWSDAGRSEAVGSGAGRTGSARDDAGGTGPAWSDAGRSEAVGSGAGRTGSARDDAGRTGAAWADAGRTDPAWADAGRGDPVGPVADRPCGAGAVRRGPLMARNSAWSDAGRTDAVRSDAGRADGPRNDAGRTDPARSETGRTETARTETGRTEPARSGAGRGDPVGPDADRPYGAGAVRRGPLAARPHGTVPGPPRRRPVTPAT